MASSTPHTAADFFTTTSREWATGLEWEVDGACGLLTIVVRRAGRSYVGYLMRRQVRQHSAASLPTHVIDAQRRA